MHSSGEAPAYWESLRVGVDLPVLMGEEVHLEPLKEGEGERTPFGQRLCEVRRFVKNGVTLEGRGGLGIWRGKGWMTGGEGRGKSDWRQG